MAIRELVVEAFLGNAHVLAFTVANVDLAGRVVKLSMALIDPRTGLFDPTEPDLVKSSATPGDMTLVNGPTGEIDVNLAQSDTGPGTGFGAGQYQFQLEVFDSGGNNGVVVSEGVFTWFANIQES